MRRHPSLAQHTAVRRRRAPTDVLDTLDLELDNAGHATAIAWAGPSCVRGESLISADSWANP